MLETITKLIWEHNLTHSQYHFCMQGDGQWQLLPYWLPMAILCPVQSICISFRLKYDIHHHSSSYDIQHHSSSPYHFQHGLNLKIWLIFDLKTHYCMQGAFTVWSAVLMVSPSILLIRQEEGTVLLLVVVLSKAAAWDENSLSQTPHPDCWSPHGAAGLSSTACCRGTVPHCSCPCEAEASESLPKTRQHEAGGMRKKVNSHFSVSSGDSRQLLTGWRCAAVQHGGPCCLWPSGQATGTSGRPKTVMTVSKWCCSPSGDPGSHILVSGSLQLWKFPHLRSCAPQSES